MKFITIFNFCYIFNKSLAFLLKFYYQMQYLMSYLQFQKLYYLRPTLLT